MIAGTPLASDVSLYVVEDQSGQLYCVNNQILNEDGTVSTAIELQEGDQIKVWGYASQYLELQEGLKIIVVQPGMIECNGKLEILDQAIELQEGDQIKVWGYASQYLELQEGLKIIVVQPGMIECNGKLEILDQNLRVD